MTPIAGAYTSGMRISETAREITLSANDLHNLVANGFLEAGPVKIIFTPPALKDAFSLKVSNAWADSNAPAHEDGSVIQTVETSYTISTIYKQGKGSLRTIAEIAAAGKTLHDAAASGA